MTLSTTTRRLGAIAVAATLALSLGACGDDADAPRELSDSAHNEADVAFARDMIPHHAQAMAMVSLAAERDLAPEVEQLTEEIRATQTAEVETLADWLVDWGEEVPETMNDHGNAGHGDDHDMSESMEDLDHDMPGMMSPEEMDALQDAPDAEFEALWLEMMVEHHTGAIEMAEVEEDEGRYRPAVELAASIIASQGEEIERMEALLAEE